MELFQANPLKPNLRVTLSSSKEVDRSTYRQSDSSDLRAIRQYGGREFLVAAIPTAREIISAYAALVRSLFG